MSVISDNDTKTESVQVNCFNRSLGYTKICFRCGTSKTISDDLFYFIPVEIPKSGKSVCTIDGCISEFLKEETLAGENKVFCSRCKQSQNHARRCVVETLPETLVLQIKRMSEGGEFKNQDRVRFERTINLTTLVKTSKAISSEYTLLSVIIHNGPLLNAGHYVSIEFQQNGTFLYDDKNVFRCSEEFLRSSTIEEDLYMLFHKRNASQDPEVQTLDSNRVTVAMILRVG